MARRKSLRICVHIDGAIMDVDIRAIATDRDVRRLSDEELLALDHALHAQYRRARSEGKATEYPYVNVHVWVVQEMHQRNMHHQTSEEDALDAETHRLMASESAMTSDLAGTSNDHHHACTATYVRSLLQERLKGAEEVILVPEYVSIVGSVAHIREDEEEINDIDVLVREDEKDMKNGWRESVMLLTRHLIDPDKTLGKHVHTLCNAQGPHVAPGQGYIPIFDLVLRPRRKLELVTKQLEKGAPELPHWERFLEEAPEGKRIDLGPDPIEGPPPGFAGLGRPFDLEEQWPLENESVAVLRANHVLEHLREPAHAMNEAWRVLIPGGVFLITVPDVSSPGAVAHPEHRSLWNKESFFFWTNEHLLRTVENRTPEPFELLYLDTRRVGSRTYIDAVLRKPDTARTAADEELAKRQEQALAPIARFTPPKPAMKGRAHTDAFSPDEIWSWVEKHIKNHSQVVAEPKYNGFRAIIQHKHPRLSITFEDSQQERADTLLAVDQSLEELHELPNCILDCDVGVVENDERWSRPRLMTLTAQEPALPEKARIAVTAFDVLYWDGESINLKPFSERRKLLERIEPLLKSAGIAIPPQMVIHSKADLEKAWKSSEFGLADGSEGLVLKSSSWVYEPVPSTDGMAKIKHALEVKAIVLEVKETKNGQYNFRGGLLPGEMGDELENIVEFGGEEYVDLGFSFNAPFAAKVGDIITAEVEEITYDVPDGRLNWLGAKPLDIDRERKEPYYAEQVLDMARRARVLQEVPLEDVEKSGKESWLSAEHYRQPIASPGGKTRIARKIITLIPDHATYVEPYAGGAAVFWCKKPSRNEVLNDINSDIMAVYRFLKGATDDELEDFARRDWIGKEELFEKLVASKPKRLVDRAYRSWYMSRFGYHHVNATKGNFRHVYEGQKADITPERLRELRGRLQHVVLLNKDALDVIREYDAPDAFFYIDPPYVGVDTTIYRYRASVEHLQKLGSLLKSLKGKALVSGNYETLRCMGILIDRGAANSGWSVRRVGVTYSLSDHKPRFEYLAANYDIEAVAKSRVVRPYGPDDAPLAIVGDGPGEIEEREGRPLVGLSGRFLRRVISELGADPDRIWYANVYETRDAKHSREDARSRGKALIETIEQMPRIRVVLALSQIAAQALTGADGKIEDIRTREFKTPKGIPIIITYHPSALLRTGQKSSRYYHAFRSDVRRALVLSGLLRDETAHSKETMKAARTQTRGELALQNWEENWHLAMPVSGKALPFILHAHWRGLSEAEAELGMDDLLKTNNSLHFDLRLGTDQFNGWFGISLFAGTTEENREELRIFRMMHDPEERLESAPKQFGPAAWLTVGLDKPLIVPPAGVGSTSKAWSKFFAIDHGTWRLGMARVHGLEIWLYGERLKGRFLWQYAPVEEGEERTWLFTRPEDQRPYALVHRLDDVVKELASKHQKWLFWPNDPEQLESGLQKIDVEKAVKELRKYVVLKREEERRYTLGVAYPASHIDAHGDYTTPDELEEAAWTFMQKVRFGRASIGLMHRTGTDGSGTVVESYIYRGPDWHVNGEVVRNGDWLLGVIWEPNAWELIKKGEIKGYSIQGFARKS